ncbi:MAG: TauD/TfdA family dioxygenase, partial [Pseudomonadales bacterium]
MKVSPFSPGCGALVSELQLAEISDLELAELRQAFAEHGLLFFREQKLSSADHLAFACRFGELVINKFFKPVENYPDIAEVRKDKTQKTNIGGGWHTDHSYDDIPAMGSILVARDLPETGGDTRFANLAAAYDDLSSGMKQCLQSLRAIHSNKHLYGEDGYYRTTDLADQLGGADSVGDAVHPVVITHPESGRKILYVNPGHTLGFEGWSIAESRALLDYLYAHVDQPQYTCQFNWQPGSVTFWDNRSTWHFAQNDYQGQSR